MFIVDLISKNEPNNTVEFVKRVGYWFAKFESTKGYLVQQYAQLKPYLDLIDINASLNEAGL